MKRYARLTLKTLIALSAAMAFTGCSEQEDHSWSVQSEGAVSFGADVAQTRASNQTDALSDLYGDDKGFGVFACYTDRHKYASSNVAPDFMCNQQVTWNATNGTWQYAPLKYWPNGYGDATDEGTGEQQTYVSFFAYAPWSDIATSACVYDHAKPTDGGDPWICYQLADERDKQLDLLYGLPVMDKTKPGIGEKVQFDFHHALGCVGDVVRLKCGKEVIDIVDDELKDGVVRTDLFINDITIDYELTAKGRLNLWTQNGQPNWSPILSENTKTTRQVKWTGLNHLLYDTQSGGVTPWEDQGKGIFYIPLEGNGFSQQAVVEVAYTLRRYTGYDPVSKVGVYTDYQGHTQRTINLSDQGILYGAGKKMDLDINLTSITPGVDPDAIVHTPPLTIQALGDGKISIGSPLSYKKNGGEMTSATTEISVNNGDIVELYGNGSKYESTIGCDQPFYLYGNIMSLIFGKNYEDKTDFTGKDANTFQNVFGTSNDNWENLQNHPSLDIILPATTLKENCYFMLFFGCKSLTRAPALPATNLAGSCYQLMFAQCTGLTTAPKLPATTLAPYCYSYMFQKCTGLTEAPELPAATLPEYCYNRMFADCSNLKYIKCLATDIGATYCTSDWVSGVSGVSWSGTFVKAASMTGWTDGDNGIPAGWTIVNE